MTMGWWKPRRARRARLLGEFREAAVEFGDRLRQLLAAHRVRGRPRLPLELDARKPERLQALFERRVLDDATALDPSLLQFVEAILDSRLSVNKSFRTVPHSLLFAYPPAVAPSAFTPTFQPDGSRRAGRWHHAARAVASPWD
jgi:hypothetical protein